MAQGKVDILLGTQMIAKGLDFPNVTVVGVVDADTGLHLPDFRAAERTFQLVAQVAGRAGRGPKGGRVRSEEHTSELQSQSNLVCRLLLEKKKPLKDHGNYQPCLAPASRGYANLSYPMIANRLPICFTPRPDHEQVIPRRDPNSRVRDVTL